MFSFRAQFLLVVFSVTVFCQAGRPNNIGKTGNYIKTDDCKEKQTCVYTYNATVVQTNGEEIDVSATVGLFCESTGIFEGESASRSCITVSNAVVTILNATDETNSNDDRSFVLPDRDMSGWFCFVQSSVSGKILGVFHPKNENEEAVNFKKSIVSAFQVNYLGSALANETDSLSQHTSHYNYTSTGDKQVQQRTINDRDVQKYAGNSNKPKQMLSFHQKDEIEVGSNKRVYYSKGETVIELSSKRDPDSTEDDDDDTTQDLPALGATVSYQIQLSYCQSQQRHTRSIYSSAMSSNGRITDDLLAKKDQVKQDFAYMKELNDDMPSLDETIKRVQRNADPKATGRLVRNWNKILEMESKYGPLSGTQAKLPQLIERLQKQSKVNVSSTSTERMFLYHLLSSEGSLNAQKALLEMLHYPLTEEEHSDLLLEIALLSSAHASTVDYFITYLEQLDDGDDRDQFILSLGTLGRHSNVEEKIVNLLLKKLETIQHYNNDTASVTHVIHALGNTGSKRMIPILIPFLSADDPQLQLAAIDALRTVTLKKQVQEAFVTVVKNSLYVEQVIEVVESLIFPFKHSIYFSDEPEDYIIEQNLLETLLQAADNFHNTYLYKALRTYASYVSDKHLSEQLQQQLSVVTRERRSSSTTNWNSNSDSKYNLIASQSTRTNDEVTYPYHRAYLWADKKGPSKLHIKVAAGGFGGIGISGFKAYARGRVDVFVWKWTYTAMDVKYSYIGEFSGSNPVSSLRYVRIAGITYVNYQSTTTATISYTRNWHWSRQIFYKEINIFILVGTLDFYIEGRLNGNVTFNANIANANAVANVNMVPSITVTAGASTTVLLIWRIGVDISATFGYSIKPQASATACDTSPVGDATACFRVYTQPVGTVEIYAYTRGITIRCRWLRCRIKWKAKKKVSSFSTSWNLVSSPPTLRSGYCKVCNCYGSHILNTICNGYVTYGSSYCSCYNQYTG